MDRQLVGFAILRSSPGIRGAEQQGRWQVHRRLPIHGRTTARRKPVEEWELLMDQLRRFVWPIATGGSVLVIALIALVAWISPEGHKVSAANANKVILLGQETSLQAEISALAHASAHEPENCSTLREDLTLAPVTPTVDLFLHQISQLATNAGTATPSVSITSSGTAASVASPSGAETVG